MVVGDSGHILTSTDAITWTKKYDGMGNFKKVSLTNNAIVSANEFNVYSDTFNIVFSNNIKINFNSGVI